MEKRSDFKQSINYFIFSLLVALFYHFLAHRSDPIFSQSLIWAVWNVVFFIGHVMGSKICTVIWLLINFAMHLVVLFKWGLPLDEARVILGHYVYLGHAYLFSGILAPFLAYKLFRLNFPKRTKAEGERPAGWLAALRQDKLWTSRSCRSVMAFALCLVAVGAVYIDHQRSAAWQADLDILMQAERVDTYRIKQVDFGIGRHAILASHDLSESEEEQLIEVLQESKLKRSSAPANSGQQYEIDLYDSQERRIGRIAFYGENRLLLEYADIQNFYTSNAALIDTLEAFLA